MCPRSKRRVWEELPNVIKAKVGTAPLAHDSVVTWVCVSYSCTYIRSISRVWLIGLERPTDFVEFWRGRRRKVRWGRGGFWT